MSSAAVEQFELALQLVRKILGAGVERKEASTLSKQLINQARDAEQIIGNEKQWYAQHRDLERRLSQQQQAKEALDTYHKQYHIQLTDESTLEQEREAKLAQVESLELELETLRESELTNVVVSKICRLRSNV